VKKSILSLFLAVVMVLTFSTSVFAKEVTTTNPTIFNPIVTFEQDNTTARVPNGIPIKVTPTYSDLTVWVGNIGVDPLDNVTVSGTATDYGTLSTKTGKVYPIVGKDFVWNVPMTKSHMQYNVSISIVDGSGTRSVTGTARLDYSEEQLSSLRWHQGSFVTRGASLDYHFKTHKNEVGTSNLYEYLIAADQCRQDVANNPSNYTATVSVGATLAHKYKNNNDGRFIILSDYGNEILSFGR
jgi:hypothetical protein